jgi:hypothetical protein
MIPAGQVTPVLDASSLAQSIHPGVALPVEHLLITLVSGSAPARREPALTLDGVRMAAVQVNDLASALI